MRRQGSRHLHGDLSNIRGEFIVGSKLQLVSDTER
jgi:hypothetical protein